MKDKVSTPSTAAAPVNPRAKSKNAEAAALETEFKFEVPKQSQEAVGAELAALGAFEQRLDARYFDTGDDRLASSRMSLRLRREGEVWVQTVKGEGEGGAWGRLEHEVPLAASDTAPTIDLNRHRGSRVGDELLRVLGGDASLLQERFRSDVLRQTCEIRLGRTRIELAFDRGVLESDGAQAVVSELEFELKAGKAVKLAKAARPWIAGHGLWLQPESKAARGHRLRRRGDQPAAPVVKATASPIRPIGKAAASLRALVRNCLEHVLPNAAAIAAGSVDHEHVHQARVGLRRLRTVIRELGDLAPRRDLAKHEPVLAAAFRSFGEVRDRETVLAAMKPRLLAAGIENLTWTHAAGGEEASLADTARSSDLQRAFVELLAFTLSERKIAGLKEDGLDRQLHRRLSRLHAAVAKAGPGFRELPAGKQHDVRKRLKRLRYLTEFSMPLYAHAAVERYLEALKPAQEALGEHNDLAMAAELAAAAARKPESDARLALDWFHHQLERSARASHKAVCRVGEAPRFWRRDVKEDEPRP